MKTLIALCALCLTLLYPALTTADEAAMPDCWGDAEQICIFFGESPSQFFAGDHHDTPPELPIDQYWEVVRVAPIITEEMGTELIDCYVELRQQYMDELDPLITVGVDDEGVQYILDLDGEMVPYRDVGINVADCSSSVAEQSQPAWDEARLKI